MTSSFDLTHGDVTRILQIVDQLSDIEVRLEVEGMKLHVRKNAAGVAGMTGSAAVPMVGLDTSATAPTPVASPPARAAAPTVAEKHAAAPAPPGATALGSAADSSGLFAVRSPMLGRFFRAASPADAPYVEVGSKVEPNDTVCMIEVMKLFSTVNADVSGTVVEIGFENGAMVEHDALLFLVKPE